MRADLRERAGGLELGFEFQLSITNFRAGDAHAAKIALHALGRRGEVAWAGAYVERVGVAKANEVAGLGLQPEITRYHHLGGFHRHGTTKEAGVNAAVILLLFDFLDQIFTLGFRCGGGRIFLGGRVGRFLDELLFDLAKGFGEGDFHGVNHLERIHLQLRLDRLGARQNGQRLSSGCGGI